MNKTTIELSEEDGPVLVRAIQLLHEEYKRDQTIPGPVSFLQRHLRLGYNQGLRIAQYLEYVQVWKIRDDAENERVAVLNLVNIQEEMPSSTSNQPSFKEVTELQKAAFSALLLVNGGAVVAILTLIGNLGGKQGCQLSSINSPSTRIALVCFAFGLFLSVLTAVAALFWTHAMTRTLPASKCIYHLSVRAYVPLFIASLIFFVIGSGVAIYALANI